MSAEVRSDPAQDERGGPQRPREEAAPKLVGARDRMGEGDRRDDALF